MELMQDRRISELDCGITYGRGGQGPENDGRWLGSPRTAGAPEVAAPISAKRQGRGRGIIGATSIATQQATCTICYAPNYGFMVRRLHQPV